MGRERYTIRPPAPNILTDGLFGRDSGAAVVEVTRKVISAIDYAKDFGHTDLVKV
jgi:hypothetical protein